ncbi:hypothetical protein D1O30_13225 [Methylocystis hirsuta]|uniref:Uncharacterized protein n=1 Tax=Methylocystis hirsuta TaxID=369798 RepID=A0A3M9XRI9_9HYPH|nr:hypothetical protein D1O30_13225 [Methylocystis hirsuta]
MAKPVVGRGLFPCARLLAMSCKRLFGRDRSGARQPGSAGDGLDDHGQDKQQGAKRREPHFDSGQN